MIRLDLPVNPIPHSCLHARTRGKQRWVSNADKLDQRRAFREEMILRIPNRHKQAFTGPLRVAVTFWRRGQRAADGDNLAKELLDALVESGVLEDDRHVVSCTWTIAEQGPKVSPRILVEISHMSEGVA